MEAVIIVLTSLEAAVVVCILAHQIALVVAARADAPGPEPLRHDGRVARNSNITISIKLVSLADARELAVGYRRIARDGGDPLAVRCRAQATVATFEAAAIRHAHWTAHRGRVQRLGSGNVVAIVGASVPKRAPRGLQQVATPK